MLAKDMCSKNPEVGTLFAQFITKVFLIQRIFRVLRNSFFQNKRGYRWTTKAYHVNKKINRQGEIEILLQDLLEFAGVSRSGTVSWNNYCLQPIVLQKKENNKYYVVDGQQRLTTLAIISHVLLNDEQTRKLPWDIVYEDEHKLLSECLLKPREPSSIENPVKSGPKPNLCIWSAVPI